MNHLSIDELLEELRRRRWVVYIFGPREEPEVCAAVFQWDTCADVLILRGEERASAFRVTTVAETDVFRPALVSWQYHSTADWTLRAVLTIPPPGETGDDRSLLAVETRSDVSRTQLNAKLANAGLATLIMGIFDGGKLRSALKIPETEVPVVVLALGYPADVPQMPKRRALEEVLRVF